MAEGTQPSRSRPSSDVKDDFCAALDASPVRVADSIVVLRNHSTEETMSRVRRGVSLMDMKFSSILMMSHDYHTRAEAERFAQIAAWSQYSSIVIVTHRYHHYRAYLTFRRVFDVWCPRVAVYSSPVDSAWRQEEFDKIPQYAAAGHCYDYQAGLESLKR